METYQLHTNTNLVIFSSNDDFYMVDTGAPFSLARSPFMLNGMEFRAQRNNAFKDFSLDQISNFVGVPLSALIGCNILKKFDWRIRWNDNEIDVGNNLTPYDFKLPLKNICNGPLFSIMIDNRPTKAFFDTGAHISYIDRSYIGNKTCVRTERDFHPFFGYFESPIYRFRVSLNHNSNQDSMLDLEFGVLPSALEAMTFSMMKPFGIGAIIGTTLLKHYHCCISWRNKSISFLPASNINT